MQAAAEAHPDLHVMEAFMYRVHPQWERVRELIRQGTIGELRTVHTTFSDFNENPADQYTIQADRSSLGLVAAQYQSAAS